MGSEAGWLAQGGRGPPAVPGPLFLTARSYGTRFLTQEELMGAVYACACACTCMFICVHV